MGNLFKKVAKNISKKVSKSISKEEIGDIALKTGIAFVSNVITKRGVSTNIKFLVESSLFNQIENKDIPEKAMAEAMAIKNIFNSAGVTPKQIAIDGVPGSGKSALSRALGKVLDMKPVSLDHYNMDKKINFISSPAVFEHHRLLRTQDIDSFDSIIYIDEPVENSKDKILHRKRGSYLVDIMNFDLMKKIGQKAFALADGDVYHIADSFIKIKIRFGESYNVMENISHELQLASLEKCKKFDRDQKSASDKIGMMAKEAMIFLIEEGKIKKGFTAYLNPIAYKQELINAVLDAVDSKTKLPWKLSSDKRNY